MSHFNDHLDSIVRQLQAGYNSNELFFNKNGLEHPNPSEIIDILNDFRQLLFPGYFGTDQPTRTSAPYFAGQMLHSIYERLYPQIRAALAYQEGARSRSVELRAEEAAAELMAELPRLQKLLLIDVEAALNGDPAAGSKEQIILSYPGLRAIFTYRIAHELYIRNIPYIPRIMTEHAHSRTGIDINSGATIGEYFFIDHGTGVVIGETTNIGNNVKIYQGVTLGALSTRAGLKLAGKKRHPTIEDDVTIYSNASVLGGNTVIGRGSTIGGSAFITSSIPPFSRVSMKTPELTVDDFGEKEYEASGESK